MKKSLDIEKEISGKIIKNPEDYLRDMKNIDKKVKKSKAIYKGEPVPYLYIPRLFNNEDINIIKK